VLCKDINIKIHKTVNFLIVFVTYLYENWCLTLREEHTAEGVQEWGAGGICIMSSFMVSTPHRILFG
jgi:hypothetical protein